jgi:hypothetical protein
MKAGDKIRFDIGWSGCPELRDFIIEEYRYCLGIFIDEAHRRAGRFIPLCDMYGAGPDSKEAYEPNVGEYTTNEVPLFMNIP